MVMGVVAKIDPHDDFQSGALRPLALENDSEPESKPPQWAYTLQGNNTIDVLNVIFYILTDLFEMMACT